MNKKGLPEMTPQFKQSAKDLMAAFTAFAECNGIAHLAIDISSATEMTIYGKHLYDSEGNDAGFWIAQLRGDDIDVRFLEN
jgi:hypothetical protein